MEMMKFPFILVFHLLILPHYLISTSNNGAQDENCSQYDEQFQSLSYPSDLHPNSPMNNVKSFSMFRIFLFFQKNGTKLFYNDRQIPCYQWKCVSIRNNQFCEYCLPHVVVAGFSKCGSTSFSGILNYHPNLTLYVRKEVNVFVNNKLPISLADFEKQVDAKHVYDMPKSFKETVLWVDGSNILVKTPHSLQLLRKLSPLTKVIMIVRDPYQALASLISMKWKTELIQSNTTFQNKTFFQENLEQHLLDDYHRNKQAYHSYVNDSQSRFDSLHLQMDKISKLPFYFYMIGELIFPWYILYRENLSVFDNYDMENNPYKIITHVEDFLRIPHVEYPDHILHLHYNTFGKWSMNESWATTHRQVYNFSAEMKSLIRPLYSPSLCFFQHLFGWKIYMNQDY